jgi:hypothetical protein
MATDSLHLLKNGQERFRAAAALLDGRSDLIVVARMSVRFRSHGFESYF